MAKGRRAKLTRGIDHVLATAEMMRTPVAYEVEWLRDELLAAIRVVREMDKVVAIYEESFHDDLKRAVREALEERDANDQSAVP